MVRPSGQKYLALSSMTENMMELQSRTEDISVRSHNLVGKS